MQVLPYPLFHGRKLAFDFFIFLENEASRLKPNLTVKSLRGTAKHNRNEQMKGVCGCNRIFVLVPTKSMKKPAGSFYVKSAWS